MYLKSHKQDSTGWPKMATLIDPPNLMGKIKSDTELYAAIKKHGSATILTSFENPTTKKTLTPEQFQEEWRGD